MKPIIENVLTIKTLFILLITVFFTNALNAELLSGYEFIKPETKVMQDDDFANPGLLTVDRGKELFDQEHVKSKKTCDSCHGEQGEKLNTEKIASYPVVDNKKIITLQKRISYCRSNITEQTLPTDHEELLALETYVRNRAKGEKVNVKTDGAASLLIEKGKKLFNTRYGLIDMSCNHCHTLYPGSMIRGQKISQGMANGFPAYRLATGEIANLQQRIQQCMILLRADPFATDSEEINQLGLYLMSRSNGLAIETPAVRY